MTRADQLPERPRRLRLFDEEDVLIELSAMFLVAIPSLPGEWSHNQSHPNFLPKTDEICALSQSGSEL